MQLQNETIKYDVVIVGAGPAGCACALTLKGAGLKVAMLDKASFPRDKVCGDAIPGRAIKALTGIDPAFEEAFKQFPKKYATKKTTLYYKQQSLTFQWVREAYTCARMDFDNFLFELVKKHTGTSIFTNTIPGTLVVGTDSITIPLKNTNKVLETKILTGADGAHSVVAKQLAGSTLDREHHVGSVRAYFSNVAGTPDDTTEIYFDKSFLPSYLWVFPLPGGMTNVGFGMLSGEIARRKINIRKTFYEFIERSPLLKLKFKDAVQAAPLEGFGLPLGSKIGTLSGARFMLAGDAASLIDPVSGDGIGNAMISGKLSAEQITRCFKEDNFTAGFMKQYDDALLYAIGSELKTHHRLQRMLSKTPLLLDAIFLAGRNKALKTMIQKSM